nr:protein yippee-like At5g53940 [Coffea arabica]
MVKNILRLPFWQIKSGFVSPSAAENSEPKRQKLSNESTTEPAIDMISDLPELFDCSVNISVGPREDRMMLSGMHTVADIYCCRCGQIVGWKYEAAHEKSQKYKEGKFVLERGGIMDGLDSEFYIDTRPSMSDAEDA